MPTYEYECGGCGHRFERFQRIHDAPVRGCPACKKSKARRLISAGAGFIFKGSGFYVTDHKKSGASPAEAKKKTQRKVKGETKDGSTGKDSSGGTE